MNKKLIIILLVIVLIVGALLLFFLGKSSTPANPTTNQGGTPFGQTSGDNVRGVENTNNGSQNSNNTISVQNDNGAVIQKIITQPIAGFTSITSGSTTIVRYAERGTGKVNDVDLKNISVVFQKVSADTQSRVIYAYFLNQGRDLIRFKENDDGNFDALYSSLSSTSTTAQSKQITGKILLFTTNILNNKDIFVMGNDLGSTISITNPDGSGVKKIWSGSLQDINIQALNKDIIAFQNRPGRNIYGAVFLTSGGAPVLFVDGKSGFKSNINADASFAVFSDYSNNDSPVQIFDKLLNKKWNLFIPTIPEKCVWSKLQTEIVYCFEYKGQFRNLPDDWYSGVTYLDSGKLWKISAKTSQESVVADFSSISEGVDALRPEFSSDEKTLFFINKRDNSLWSIDLSRVRAAF